MNVHTGFQMMSGVVSRIVIVMVIMLLASACGSDSTNYRPPNLNELQALSRDKGILPVADHLLGDSVVLLYDQSTSFGYYVLTARESDGALVELEHVTAAKSDEPILIIGRLTGDHPFMAVVIQDTALSAETTAIEVSLDPQNRLTATTNNQTGVILVSPSPVGDWEAVTLYNAQGGILYRQEGP